MTKTLTLDDGRILSDDELVLVELYPNDWREMEVKFNSVWSDWELHPIGENHKYEIKRPGVPTDRIFCGFSHDRIKKIGSEQ